MEIDLFSTTERNNSNPSTDFENIRFYFDPCTGDVAQRRASGCQLIKNPLTCNPTQLAYWKKMKYQTTGNTKITFDPEKGEKGACYALFI